MEPSVHNKDFSLLIVDMCSNKNAGDAAMQTALFELLFDIHEHGNIVMATRFGNNQKADALNEFAAFKGLDNIELVAGSYPTHVHFGADEDTFKQKLRKARKAFAALCITPLLIALSLGFQWLPRLLANFQGGDLLKRAKNSDVIIWNGRNVRLVDGVRGYFKLVELLANPALLSLVKKRKFMYGVSFWPVRTKFSKLILRGVMARYDTIYVRETESLRIAEEIGLDNIGLMPDLSFYFLKNIMQISESVKSRKKRESTVAITLVGARELTNVIGIEAYIKLVSSAVKFLSKEYGLSPVIVRQVTYGPELEDQAIELLRRECNNLVVLPPPQKVEDLLKVYSGCRMLLATRMHSAIFAISCRTPVVALPYDWKGKWQILGDLGLPTECIIPLRAANLDQLKSGLKVALSETIEWDSMARRLSSEADRLRQLVEVDFKC